MTARLGPVARGRAVGLAATAEAALIALTACTSGSGPSTSGGSDHADTVSYALPAGVVPNWILPISTPGHTNSNNYSIQNLLWEPLIAYNGSSGSGKIQFDPKASVASSYTFSPDGTSVTITLNDMKWSDGEPVTSRDVEFWFNLVTANKTKWARYRPGAMPDDVSSFTTVDDHTFTLTFDKVYNQNWLLSDNQLNEITPLPYHAWAKTSADATVDTSADLDRTTAGAQAIFSYLNEQAMDVSSYSSNPLWKVVDGPYTLSQFTTTGQVTFVKNAHYDGKDPASIGTVKLLPFTTVDAEENAVRAKEVDYGYIAPTDVSQKSTFTRLGYQIEPWKGWAITYIPYNFNNPTLGAAFKQLYVRQAVQRSIDQKNIAGVIWNGAATPTYGPIPQGTPNDFISSTQKTNPYPYDPSAAKKLLTSHGWSIGSDGIAACAQPGTADDQCGAGVAAGTTLSMTLVSQSGSTVTDNMMSTIKSSLAKAGIGLTVKDVPANEVLAQTPKCTPDDAACSWQLSFFGTAGSWYFPAYPTGDQLFYSGGPTNFGSYADSQVDSLIEQSSSSTSNEPIQQYSAALTKQLPVIWLPNPDYQVSAVSTGLKGVTQDPLSRFHPQRWSW